MMQTFPSSNLISFVLLFVAQGREAPCPDEVSGLFPDILAITLLRIEGHIENIHRAPISCENDDSTDIWEMK
jgi:hypothetical protein